MSIMTGNLHGSSKYISTWQKSVFCRKRVPIMFWIVSVFYKRGPFHVHKSQRFEKKGLFLLSKSQWKGVSFKFGEQSYVLPTAVEWRDRGYNPSLIFHKERKNIMRMLANEPRLSSLQSPGPPCLSEILCPPLYYKKKLY